MYLFIYFYTSTHPKAGIMAAIKISSGNQLNKRVIATKCPVTYTLHKTGGRWKPIIINQLLLAIPQRQREALSGYIA